MKKKIIYLCSLLMLFGCDKFLDINPKSETVDDDMFASAEGYEDALYGVYASLAQEDLYGGRMSVLIPELLAQNFQTTHASLLYVSRLDYKSSWAKSEYRGLWKNGYLVISYLNNIIGHLEEHDEESFPHYLLYKGEALGLRAFIHFDLLRLFAVDIRSADADALAKAIPYVTRYTFHVTPYSSVADAYDLILADLKEAERCLSADEELFPAVRQRGGTEFTEARELHFNLYAAQALLARVYWMKGDLKMARQYAEKVITSGKFPLAQKTELAGLVKGTLSPKETIWGLNTNDFKEYIYGLQVRTSNLILPSDYEDRYLTTQGPEPGKDFRLEAWFDFLDYAGGGGRDVCIKILEEQNTTAVNAAAYAGVNLIRIPEMYYIIAEALLDEGDRDGARTYLDEVIASRGMVKFAERDFSPAITLEDIMLERKKEFIGEGQEWYSLKRRNQDIYVYAWSKTYSGSDEVYTLPKPTQETDYRED